MELMMLEVVVVVAGAEVLAQVHHPKLEAMEEPH